MRILVARYRDGEELLRHYLPAFPDGGLFFPTRTSIPEGQPILVEISFPGLPQRQLIRARIAWQRAGRHRAKLRAGLALEFLPTETGRRDFVLRAARYEVGPLAARRHRRVPVDLPAEWRLNEARVMHRARIEDIGPGGAFLRVSTEADPSFDAFAALAPGNDLLVELLPPGSVAPLGLAARVAWVCRDRVPGIGIEFRRREGGGSRRLKELVRRIEVDLQSATTIAAAADESDPDAPDDEEDAEDGRRGGVS